MRRGYCQLLTRERDREVRRGAAGAPLLQVGHQARAAEGAQACRERVHALQNDE